MPSSASGMSDNPNQAGETDFRVYRCGQAGWMIEAVSSKARDFVQSRHDNDDRPPVREGFMTDNRGANEFVARVRAYGYRTDLLGPRGPIRL